MRRLTRSLGLSISEYAIILALAVVIGIAGLAMMGGNVSTMLAGIIPGSGNATTNPGGGGAGDPDSIDISQVNKVEVVTGPNGEITYQVTVNTGAGSQVTSVSGNVILKTMAKQLEDLIAEQKAAGNVDPSLQSGLDQFNTKLDTYEKQTSESAKNAATFAEETAKIHALEAEGKMSPPPYHSPEISNDVFAQTEAFINMNQAYQNLSSMLQNNPQYSEVGSEVNQIAGMVSNVAIADKMASASGDTYANRINPQQLMVFVSEYPKSVNYLSTIQGQTIQQVGPDSPANHQEYVQTFRDNLMATSQTQWMGDSSVSTIAGMN